MVEHCGIDVLPVFKLYELGKEVECVDGGDLQKLKELLNSILTIVGKADLRFFTGGLLNLEPMRDVLKKVFFTLTSKNLPNYDIGTKSLKLYTTTNSDIKLNRSRFLTMPYQMRV